MRRPLALSALVAILVHGCTPPQAHLADDIYFPPPRPDRPIHQALGPNGHHVLFLNFDGVTLLPDYDDAVHNKSSIASGLKKSLVVPPFDYANYSNKLTRDQIIGDVTAKVKSYWAAYNIDIVTSRPPTGDYVMAAIGGLPDIINQPCQGGCTAGYAPLDCQRKNNQAVYNYYGDTEVVYAFSAIAKYFTDKIGPYPYDDKIHSLAVTIAQEAAHAFGLGHSDNPQDIMYPQSGDTVSGFLSGKYADSGNCNNSVGTQDANALLLQILGKNAGNVNIDQTPPTVAIAAPDDGATVGKTFAVAIDATDNAVVDHVSLSVTGPGNAVNKSLMVAPYATNVTANADGEWTITATAFDAAGNKGVAHATVTVQSGSKLSFGSPCSASSQCQSGLCAKTSKGMVCTQTCGSCPNGFHCNSDKVCDFGNGQTMMMMMSMPHPLGDDCSTNSDCQSGLCVELNGRHFCSGKCSLDDATSCPQGLVCQDFGSDGALCVYGESGNSVSSCAMGRPRPAGAGWVFCLALLLFRRRRSCESFGDPGGTRLQAAGTTGVTNRFRRSLT